METLKATPQDLPTQSSPNLPLSQVLAIALVCGSLTFSCLYSAFQGKTKSAQQTVATHVSTTAPTPSTLADNTAP